jgi:signal transduction histidine kinase
MSETDQLAFLREGGHMGSLMRAHDWTGSALGPPARWPQTLRTVVRIMLNTGHPMYIFWGPELSCLYNDAYSESIGPERHPISLGRPGREVWDEISNEGRSRAERSEAELREADKQEDEFLAMLAHELRNPLASIRTGLELVRLAGDTRGAVERVRSTMERQVGHMVRLIDDLLDVSRITAGKIELQRVPSSLHDLVASAVDGNRAAASWRLGAAVGRGRRDPAGDRSDLCSCRRFRRRHLAGAASPGVRPLHSGRPDIRRAGPGHRARARPPAGADARRRCRGPKRGGRSWQRVRDRLAVGDVRGAVGATAGAWV